MWARCCRDSKEYIHTETEYDTEEEWKEEVKLIDELYADTPHPKFSTIKTKWNAYKGWSYNVGDRFWGYVVLDFQESKIPLEGNDGIHQYFYEKWTRRNEKDSKHRYYLRMLDDFFRGDDEIPKGYEFDDGEYNGWLQFRWGDGKNAITCKHQRKSQKSKQTPLTKEEKEKIDAEMVVNGI